MSARDELPQYPGLGTNAADAPQIPSPQHEMKIYKLSIRLRKIGSCRFWNHWCGDGTEAGGKSAAKRAECFGIEARLGTLQPGCNMDARLWGFGKDAVDPGSRTSYRKGSQGIFSAELAKRSISFDHAKRLIRAKSSKMRLSSSWYVASFASLVAAGLYPADVVDQLQEAGVAKLKDYLAKNPSKSGCTFEKAVKRKEWFVHYSL